MRKLVQKTLLAPVKVRKPLSAVGILYFPKVKKTPSSLKLKQNVETEGRVKLRSYPDLSKERIEDRIAKKAKKRAASMHASSRAAKSDKSTSQLDPVDSARSTSRRKRMSKKKRQHERSTKTALDGRAS